MSSRKQNSGEARTAPRQECAPRIVPTEQLEALVEEATVDA